MSVQPFNNILNPWYVTAIACRVPGLVCEGTLGTNDLFFRYFMYQPVSYKLQGRMGSRDDLRNMINTCRALGVRVYADAVINHMVPTKPRTSCF